MVFNCITHTSKSVNYYFRETITLTLKQNVSSAIQKHCTSALKLRTYWLLTCSLTTLS